MRKLTIYLSLLTLLLMLSLMPVAAQDDAAMIRVAHFSPDAPAVDVYVDGELAVEGLEFPEVTPFLELAAGTYEVAVSASGTSVDDAVIGPVELTLEADSATTVAAVGSLESGTLTATVIAEDYSPIPDGSARITAVHAIEGESALDLIGSTILLVQTLRYPEGAGDGAFTRDVPAGRYNFEANISETDTTLRVANGVQIEAGEYYLIVALGPQALSGDLLIVTPEGYENPEDGEEMDMGDEEPMPEATEEEMDMDDEEPMMAMDGTAMIRVAHFSPDAPAVDVYVNGEVAVEGLEFPEVTAFLSLDAGTYEIAVSASGTSVDDAVIGPVELTLEADSATTVAAVGSLESGTLTATVIAEDYSPIPDGSARITVVHTIEGESALDLIGSTILLVQTLRYPQGGGDGAFTRDVPAGRYNFEANISETDTTLRVANGVQIEAGQYYLIVALGPQALSGDLLIVTPEGYENPEE